MSGRIARVTRIIALIIINIDPAILPNWIPIQPSVHLGGVETVPVVAEFHLGEPFAALEEEAVADGGGGEGGVARTVADGGEAEDVVGVALQHVALSAGHGDSAVLGVGVIIESAGRGEAGDDVVNSRAVDVGGGQGAFAVAFLQEVPAGIGEIEGGGPLPCALGPGVGAADGAAVATVVGEGQAEGTGLGRRGGGGAETVVGIPSVGPAGALEEVTLGIIGQCLAVDEGVLVQRVGSVVICRAVVHLLGEVAERIVLVAHDTDVATESDFALTNDRVPSYSALRVSL